VPPWPDSHRAVPAHDRAVPGRAGPMPRYRPGVGEMRRIEDVRVPSMGAGGAARGGRREAGIGQTAGLRCRPTVIREGGRQVHY